MKLSHLAIAVGTLVFGVSGAVMAQTPVLYYNFNNTEVGSTGSLANGTTVTPEVGPAGTVQSQDASGTFPVTAGVTGVAGQAFNFQGGNVSTVFASNPVSTAFTIDFWLNTPGGTNNNYYAENTGPQCAVLENYSGATGGSGNEIGLWNFTGTPSNFSGANIPLLENSTWENVAWTYDGTDVDAYYDGVLVSSTAASISLPSGATSWFIGGANSPYLGGSQGGIDNFYLYNSALSATQIAGLAGVSIPEPASLSLLGLGAFGLLARRRSQKA